MNQLDIQKIERAGLQCKKCNDYHYQILGGTNHQIVNFWSTKKGGSKFQVGGEQARLGNLNGAIALAGPHTVDIVDHQRDCKGEWNGTPRHRQTVGLLRRFGRWLW